MNILFASSDRILATTLKSLLSQQSSSFFHSTNGQDALFIAATQDIDVVIADDNLGSLSARSLLDYVAATFDIKTILLSIDFSSTKHDWIFRDNKTARLLREIAKAAVNTPLLDQSTIDKITFTKTEKKLVSYLLALQGRVVAKQDLQLNALSKPLSHLNQTIDMHMCNIRKKLEQAGYSQNIIKTIHNKGYCIA